MRLQLLLLRPLPLPTPTLPARLLALLLSQPILLLSLQAQLPSPRVPRLMRPARLPLLRPRRRLTARRRRSSKLAYRLEHGLDGSR